LQQASSLRDTAKKKGKMKISVLIVVLTLIGCSIDRQTDNLNNVVGADSLMIMTLGQQEQASWDYYQEIEKMMRSKRLRKDRIDDYVQALIDEGSIPEPEIFTETEEGTKSMRVDYKTYKNYRAENPIDISRDYTFRLSLPEPDTLFRDSLRINLIKALKGDTL